MSGIYTVRVHIDGRMVDLRYANWNVISTPEDALAVGFSSYVFPSKDEARKLVMHLMLSYPASQKEGWLSLQIYRHSRWPPYPAIAVVETIEL